MKLSAKSFIINFFYFQPFFRVICQKTFLRG
ncbi:hypothetical protein MSKU15_3149 [Komagataeibacter diospyri]|nr:hypothetical protein MSKU15_3149 [Komagataeibacter diospyri]